MQFSQSHVDELLTAWPRLRRRPSRRADVVIVGGVLDFRWTPPGRPAIADTYQVRLEVPLFSTEALPDVYEEGQRVPRTPDNHVNSAGNLCLGSPLQLQLKLGHSPTLLAYVDQCVIPFLYAASWRQRGYAGYPFEELEHGAPGLYDDYQRLLGLPTDPAVRAALLALTKRKRVANKLPCPCGCARRVGRCNYRASLNAWRRLASRAFFRKVLAQLLALDAPAAPAPSAQRRLKLANSKRRMRNPVVTRPALVACFP
ncbi:TPA: hypothetical protein UM343_000096 [Stenotrophomonas maltophilia]|nr:hypothetical protein [Stenotrophomonas maltophilia]